MSPGVAYVLGMLTMAGIWWLCSVDDAEPFDVEPEETDDD